MNLNDTCSILLVPECCVIKFASTVQTIELPVQAMGGLYVFVLPTLLYFAKC